MKTIDIKGKSYVTVNERLREFRSNALFKGYSLKTELVEVNEKSALIRAVVCDADGKIVATGTSFERADNKRSMVNATSHVENCETSAWGRALGNLGIGIDTSVATAEEVMRAPQKVAYTDQADEEAMAEVEHFCSETQTDKAKLFAFFQVKGIPTKDQAQKMIVSLKAKLSKQIDAQ
jgi:hypothetical protein